jgi:uncharacterized membrane protein YvbJ
VPYCQRCGTKLEEDAHFCHRCGTPVGTFPTFTTFIPATPPTPPKPAKSMFKDPLFMGVIVLVCAVVVAVIVAVIVYAPILVNQINQNSGNFQINSYTGGGHVNFGLQSNTDVDAAISSQILSIPS